MRVPTFQLVDPRSGTIVLLTLRPEHLAPLVDQTKGDFYRLRIGGLDRADALLLLSELLRLRVQSAPPHGIARGRLEEPAALAELAEAADGSPSLLRTAITLLKQPGDSDAALRRLRELSQQYQQQTAPPRRPAAARPRMERYLLAALVLVCLAVMACFAFSGSRWPVLANETCTRDGDKYQVSFVLTNPAAPASTRSGFSSSGICPSGKHSMSPAPATTPSRRPWFGVDPIPTNCSAVSRTSWSAISWTSGTFQPASERRPRPGRKVPTEASWGSESGTCRPRA